MELNEHQTDASVPAAAMPSPRPSDREATAPELRLLVKGLAPAERLLLDGLVRMSQRDTRRRTQSLKLVDDASADIVIVDCRDAAAMAWARAEPWLAKRAVIWIDAGAVPPGHTATRRPVQWPVLHILLAKALEERTNQVHVMSTLGGDAPPPRPSASNLQPRILIVDDSPMVRTQLRGLLAKDGYESVEAGCVAEALTIAGEQRISAVLMDVLMPGTDGYDGCRQLKSLLRGKASTPVVMLTSKSSPFDRIRGKMAGCDAYLTKPVDPPQLADVLLRLVRGVSSAAPSLRPVAA